MKRLRIVFLSLLASALLFGGLSAWWLTNPTRAYYETVAVSIDQDSRGVWIAKVTRVLPRGNVLMRFSITVWVNRGESSYACKLPMAKPILYLASNGPTVEYIMPDEVSACLDEGQPLAVTWVRQAMVWGWVPTIPVEASVVFSPTNITTKGW